MTLGPCLEHQPMHRFGVGWVCGRCGEPINPSRPSPSDTPAMTEGGAQADKQNSVPSAGISAQDPLLLLDSLIHFGLSSDGAMERDLRAAIIALLARAEAAERRTEKLEQSDKEWGRLHQAVILERAEALIALEAAEKERDTLIAAVGEHIMRKVERVVVDYFDGVGNGVTVDREGADWILRRDDFELSLTELSVVISQAVVPALRARDERAAQIARDAAAEIVATAILSDEEGGGNG